MTNLSKAMSGNKVYVNTGMHKTMNTINAQSLHINY